MRIVIYLRLLFKLVELSMEEENKAKRERQTTDLMAIVTDVQTLAIRVLHSSITNARKAWILVSSLSRWSSLQSISWMAKPLKT